MKSLITRTSEIRRTGRVMQIEGMFGIAPSSKSELTWDVSLPIEQKPWNIGLIVGPSGCGKSTLAKELLGNSLITGFDWSSQNSIVDDFPKGMSIKDIVALLSSVGFSSPPSWLRPFHVLSNGEQFRVTMARAMAESSEMFVVDEFTSVVDRTVAQIGSSAIAKAIRGRGQRFVAVSCHYDIIDWLQPDWIYEPDTKSFQWRELQRRPEISITLRRVHSSTWDIFRHHHYLDTNLNKAAKCFLATVQGRPCAFAAVLSFPHAHRPGWRGHRTVCLPDFQGVGIGNKVSEFVAGMFLATGKPYFSTTGHPAMMRYRARSGKWKMHRKPSSTSKNVKTSTCEALSNSVASDRLTAGFEYCGLPLRSEAKAFGII